MPAADGLLVVDKPAGWTSHDVVARARRLCGTRKVGHAGTLDPMATGVLVLGVGRATRLLTFLVGSDKSYAATVRLGQMTITDDAEGDVTATEDVGSLDRARVEDAAGAFVGPIEQVPSSVSAIKVDGRRSYARVRSGETVELAARPVTVHAFHILDARPVDLDGVQLLDVDIEVSVSSGTYVRALARDLGATLGVGGHLTSLRRTRVGRFTLADATPLDAMAVAVDAGEAAPVLPMADAAVASFPVRRLLAAEELAVRHGQRIDPPADRHTDPVAAIGPDGELVAILDESGPSTRSVVVFPPTGS